MESEKLYESTDVSKLYSKFRPQYPKALYDTILSYCQEAGASFDTCLDLACGTGNSTAGLLPYYRKVIGVDGSESQIEQARCNLPEVEFYVSQADNLAFLQDDSVDLITVATAFHWFPDKEKYVHTLDKYFLSLGLCYHLIQLFEWFISVYWIYCEFLKHLL